jgi:hypothetical protein
VERGPDLSWLKEWRVAGTIGLLAGFLIGLLAFGEPWHLQPNWGDLPTWLLFTLGLPGLYQLRLFVQNNAEEARRNIKRDELLDRQLAEAEARALSERRRQAEGIDVGLTGNGRPRILRGRVVNNSARPVTDITCRIMSRTDASTLATPSETGQIIVMEDLGDESDFIPETVPVTHYDTLRPGARVGFLFNGVSNVEPDHILVAWFTDDAGFRWQLDEYLHLVPAGDEDEYLQ